MYSTLLVMLKAPLFAQENQLLWTVNWSADGKYIAVGGDDQVLRIFDAVTFELIRSDSIGAGICRLRWHPAQHLLAVAATGDGTRIIDLDQDRDIRFAGVKNLGGRAIAWNHNGELLAIADYDGKVSIWTKNGNHLRTIEKEATKSYVAVDWHPKKNELIALSENIRIYDLEGNLLHLIKHRKEPVLMLCVKWHRSGNFFVIGDYGDYDYDYKPLLQFWHADGTLIRQITRSKAEYRNISWNGRGTRLATASDALRIWNKKGRLLYESQSDDLLWGVDWSPDGKYLITSSMEGHIRIWDNRGKLVRELNY